MIFFKFPFNDKIFTVEENSDSSRVNFVSFDGKNTLDFKGNIKHIEQIPSISSDETKSELTDFAIVNKEAYCDKISKVIEFIKENELKKLVIARQKIAAYSDWSNKGKIDLTQTFYNLCHTYPNAFAYFFNKDGHCWVGAFSEILGKYNKENSEFETMSLAGTLPIDEEWTEKEIEEQRPVSDYILTILKNYSEDPSQSQTYDHISGNIKHLRTDFKAKIERKDLEPLIAELHPTPAVCGIPKAFCKKAIERFERAPRKFYAGYIKAETEHHIHYFVNLRCAEFTQNAAIIYVGGGITEQSNPEREWRETELKSEAILRNIAIYDSEA